MAIRFKPKLGRLLAVGAVAIVAVGLVIALFALLFGTREASLSLRQSPLEPGQDFRINGETITYATSDTFHEFRIGKSGLTTTPLGTAISGYDVNGDNMAVFSGSVLQIRGLDEVTLTGTIHAVRCGSNHVAVLRRNITSGADSIIVFDSAGVASADALDYSDGKVVNFGFYTENGSDLLWAIAVAAQQEQPVFNVKMYDYGNGGMMSYLQPFYDQAIESVFFTQDSIFVAGTQDLVRYTQAGGRERYRVRIFGQRVLDMAESSGGVSFLLQPRHPAFGETLRLLTVAEADYASESMVSLHLPDKVTSAFLQGGSLYAFTQTHLYSFNYAGRRGLVLELPAPPQRVSRVGDSNMLFETEGAVYLASITQ
ncbi:MAG: hypothetical protein FWE69_03370 [Clostridiales bacterium]|nr:hypothetical protein [Clostridiales bacterium]